MPEDPGRDIADGLRQVVEVSGELRGRPVARRGGPLPVMTLRQLVDAEDPDLYRLALRHDRGASPGCLPRVQERDLRHREPLLHRWRVLHVDVGPEQAHQVPHGRRGASLGEQDGLLRGRHQAYPRASAGRRIAIDSGIEVS